MKKLLIFLMISLVFLSGCGIFNLNGWIMPDDLEFLAVMESLDTPKKIGNYMQENFIYEYHPFYAPDPYVLWQTQKGDCNDFSTFGTFIANYHGYKTYQIRILQNDGERHYLGVYEEGLYSFTDCQYYFPGYKTFRDIVIMDYSNRFADWIWYKVYDYDMNLIEKGIK